MWLTGVPTPRASGSPGYSYRAPGRSGASLAPGAQTIVETADEPRRRPALTTGKQKNPRKSGHDLQGEIGGHALQIRRT
jgi:hypothetical protein